MRLLLSAYACLPDHGSEPGIAWGAIEQLAKRHEVWVLTNMHHEPEIRQYAKRRGPLGAEFIFLPMPRWLAPLYSTPLYYLYYIGWQILALHEARRLHAQIDFDLVHHITYGNSWIPSLMGYLGIPFVWSAGIRDVSLHPCWNKGSFSLACGQLGRLLLARSAGGISDLIAGSRARRILVAGERDAWSERLPVISFVLGGLGDTELETLGRIAPRAGRPFRVISMGNLIAWKAFDLGIQAFKAFHSRFPESEYLILGHGRERARLEKLAQKLGVADCVHFLGRLDRRQGWSVLAECDVLLHPSLRESFGYAILEAMAAGKTVICQDNEVTRQLTGCRGTVLVRAGPPRQIVAGIADALDRYARDADRRIACGESARQWASTQWNWDAVGRRLEDVYLQAVAVGDRRTTLDGGSVRCRGGPLRFR